MFCDRLRRFVAAFAAITAVLLGGSRAEAAIEIVVSSAGTTDVFYSSSSTFAQTPGFAIDGYVLQVETVFSNYAGSPTLGKVSTTVNVSSTGAAVSPLSVSVMEISNVVALDSTSGTGPVTGANLTAVENSPLLAWTAPTSPLVLTSANTSTSSQVGGPAGTAVTTTYFDSPPISGTPRTTETGGPTPGTPVAVSGALPLNVNPSPDVLATSLQSNPGPGYTLSQSLLITGAVSGNPYNVTGTSTVQAIPEPSTMALAGLGALGLVAYGLRRRTVKGA